MLLGRVLPVFTELEFPKTGIVFDENPEYLFLRCS